MVFNDEGVKEASCGIVSFAPWSAVQKIDIVEGNMFIQLANELWAIIPADALNEQPEIKEQIVRYFSEKGKSYSHQSA